MAVCLLMLLSTGVGSAGTPVSFVTSAEDIQTPVEQWTPGWLLSCPAAEPDCRDDRSLWVINPHRNDPIPYVWDTDDFITRWLTGDTLAANATVTERLFYEADPVGVQVGSAQARIVQAGFDAASPDLRMTIVIDPGPDDSGPRTIAFPAPTNLGRGEWGYGWCGPPPGYAYSDPRLQPVPGSNGGEAIPTTITLTIANPTGKAIGKMRGTWGITNEIVGGHCP